MKFRKFKLLQPAFACLLFTVFPQLLPAQSSDCEPLVSASNTSALADVLSTGNKVNSVCIVSEGDDHVAIRVNYSGFADKNYKVIGKILNSAKKPMREFEAVSFPLEKGGTTADLQFTFEKKGTGYTQAYLESKFLSVVITGADDPLSDLDLQGASVFGNSYLYKLERKFRVGGNGGTSGGPAVTVNIKLTPYKSAATIKE